MGRKQKRHDHLDFNFDEVIERVAANSLES